MGPSLMRRAAASVLLAALAERAAVAEESPPVSLAPPELMIRVDDRADRLLQSPVVSVIDGEGGRIRVVPTDDGSDPGDAFAGDRLWIARVRVSQPGRYWVVVSDDRGGSESEALARVAAVVGPRGGLATAEIDRETRPAAAITLKGGPDVDLGALAPRDFPLAPPVSRGAPTLSLWSRNVWYLLLTLSALAAVVVGFVRAGLDRSARRLADIAHSEAPTPADPPPPSRWPWRVAVGGAAALLLLTWIPPLPRIADHFLGVEYVDHYGSQWFYWFVEHAWRNDLDPSTTDLFFHPWGKDIFKHTGTNILDAWAALPLRMLFGHVLGYNLFVLLMNGVSGLAFYALAREVSDDRLACGLGAVLYSLHPYLLVEFMEGRPTQAITVLPVLFFRSLLRTGTRGGLRAPVLAGLLLAASGYQYWFYALFGGIAALAHGIWRTLRPVTGSSLATFARHVAMAAVALAVTLPVALPMVLLTTTGQDVPGLLDTSQWSINDSPPITREGIHIGMYSWQPLRQAIGFLVVDPSGENRYLSQYAALPWVCVLLLVAWYLRPGRLERGLFLAMFIPLALVCIGPVLLIGDVGVPNPPYIWLVQAVGFLRRLWWPARCILFIVLLIGLATVVVVEQLRKQGPALQVAAFAGIFLWWGMDLRSANALPFPTWDASVPAGYRCLAEGDDRGALIELPYAWTQAHLYYQTWHHRPILGGMLEDNPAFTPEEFTSFRTTNPMISRLYQGDPLSNPYNWDSKAEDEVRSLGYRYVVVQKDGFLVPGVDQDLSRLENTMAALARVFGKPVWNDGRTAIYAPWGDPLPCDPAKVGTDPALVGPTEVKQEVSEPDPSRQVFRRWRPL